VIGMPGLHPHELRHTAASQPSRSAPTSRSCRRCSATSLRR
jgi:hypothetical protein